MCIVTNHEGDFNIRLKNWGFTFLVQIKATKFLEKIKDMLLYFKKNSLFVFLAYFPS
jgi:hypothetical protein